MPIHQRKPVGAVGLEVGLGTAAGGSSSSPLGSPSKGLRKTVGGSFSKDPRPTVGGSFFGAPPLLPLQGSGSEDSFEQPASASSSPRRHRRGDSFGELSASSSNNPCARGGFGRGSPIVAILAMALTVMLVAAVKDESRQIVRLTDELSTVRSAETGLTMDLAEQRRRADEESKALHDRDAELERLRNELKEAKEVRQKLEELEKLEKDERDELQKKRDEIAHLREEIGARSRMKGNVRGAKQGNDYALLYPEPDCAGTPIRIDYSSSEKNCQNCRDFCSLNFEGLEGTANLFSEKHGVSMSVTGGHGIEIIHMCVGKFAYDKFETLNVLTPGDGCTNLKLGAAHARFT